MSLNTAVPFFKQNNITVLPSNRVLDRKPDRVTGYKILIDLTSLICIGRDVGGVCACSKGEPVRQPVPSHEGERHVQCICQFRQN